MSNKAFMFPGVGSQHVGMGKFFYDNFKVAREIFEEAGDTLKIDFARLCFSEENKQALNTLENAQVALITVSMVTYRVYMAEIGGEPLYCLGHSLGEYSALCAAGAVCFADALTIVRDRGIILNRTASGINGIMAWVINLDYKITESICTDYAKKGCKVFVSAYDSPVQATISGLKDTVMTVGRELEQEGAIVYPLPLSGPFHCPLMKAAAQAMADILRQYIFFDSRFPVLANQNAQCYENIKSIPHNLSLQLVRPIRWQDSIRYLLDKGIDTAIEMGPDKVLKHLMKNNTDIIHVYSLENQKDFEIIKNNVLNGGSTHVY